MTKVDYKRLGDYIREVDLRNEGLKITNLLGLTINNEFIRSVTNTVGTDMEKYKIIRKNQLACSTMQVRCDGKMPVALLKDFDEAIISQAYPVFEVKDENELLPDFLMMWFSRPEFDREACFHAVGGVRGSIEWDDFLDLQFPVPSQEKQCEIVAEYNAVQNRVDLNNQLIHELEETAQAIYKQWFVDFEFPNEEGKPYKCSGGEMVDSEMGEIPKGWKVEKIEEVTECNPETLSSNDIFNSILYLDTGNITDNKIFELQKLSLLEDNIPSRAKRKVQEKDIVYSTVRPNLKHYGIINNQPDNLIVSTGFAVLRVNQEEILPDLVYLFLTNDKTINFFQAKAEMSVSTYPSITADDILNVKIVIPNKTVLNLAKDFFNSKNYFINVRYKEIRKLEEFQSLLLSRLATMKN